MKALYYNAYGGNFGDELGVEIVRRLIKDNNVSFFDMAQRRRSSFPGFVGLGSIFFFVRNRDCLWGTGVNPYWQKKRKVRYSSLDIRAVRGPLSRDYIINELGLPCPEIYGDPALLTPQLFPEYTPKAVREYGIIPHFLDQEVLTSVDAIGPGMGWKAVVEFILGCELVISSSLHGLIVAEAFGIPARWLNDPALPSFKTEGRFKYNDYYASTNRSLDDFAVSIPEALEMGGKEQIVDFDYKKLQESFPSEIFSRKERPVKRIAENFDEFLMNHFPPYHLVSRMFGQGLHG